MLVKRKKKWYKNKLYIENDLKYDLCQIGIK